mmetsp:Transcript_24429/g.36432  ORF Transcript_24429/g.36432 Transcript_24429/m.36432 type:complete len:126 (-) Transcript_24429:36-413(-)
MTAVKYGMVRDVIGSFCFSYSILTYFALFLAIMCCADFKNQKRQKICNHSSAEIVNDDQAKAEKRRKEKLEQNRISAMKSRLRKKLAAEKLKKVHDNLLAEHKVLKQKHDILLSCLAEVESKVGV